MFKISTPILTLLFFCLAVVNTSAQDASSFIHFNIDNGLPSNNVYCGISDDKGNVWLGTDDGVVKYNGYSFRVFTTEDGLPSNDVWKIWKDSVGRIWLYSIATKFGYMQNDEYHSIDLDMDGAIFRVGSEGVKGDKTCFVANGRKEIFFVVDSSGNIEYTYDNNAGGFAGMSKGIILYRKSKNKGDVLEELEYKNGRLDVTNTYIDSLTDKPRYTTSTDIFGEYMFSFTYLDQSIQLDYYDIKKGEMHTMSIQSIGGTADEKIYVRLREPINATIITNKAAYIFLDDSFSKVKRIDTRHLLPTKSQLSYFMVDKDSNTWYMTNSDGVWIKPYSFNLFNKSAEIIEIEGAVYVGYGYNETSYWFNKEKEKLTKLDARGKAAKEFYTAKTVLNIKPYKSSSLLMSTKSALNIFDEQKNESKPFLDCFSYRYDFRLKRYYGAEDSLFHYDLGGVNDWIYYDDTTFYMMLNSDLYETTISGDTLIERSRLRGKYYTLLNDTFNNKIWLVNQSSAAYFDVDEKNNKFYSNNLRRLLGINSISKVLLDRHANFYILSDRNIIRYNSKTGQIQYKEINVDLSHAILALYDDMLFVGGNFGIAYCDTKQNKGLGDFRIIPNIKGRSYNKIRSIYFNKDGYGVIGTDKSNYRVTLDELRKKDNVLYTGNPYFLHVVARLPKEVLLHDNDTFRLEQNIPSIGIDLNNFYGKGKIAVRYKVEGSTSWQEVKSGDVILAGLKVDKYYTVYCNVKDELWTSKTYKFIIYRIPKWWQTSNWRTAFWISGVLGFVMLLISVVLVTRHIVAKNNEKKQQLTDLELRAVYSQINPHFIFNTLSTALFFIDKKDFDQAYTHVSKFSKLLRSYLKSSQERYVSIAEEIRMLENYIELQQIRFENKFDYDIEVENKIAIDSILIPSLLLQPLVENAINHGLFHKKGSGELIIRFKQGEQPDELLCEIEDNGVGRAKSVELQKDSATKKESYGTKLTQSLIEIFKEYEKMNIYMEYVDKVFPESGTIVKLTIKQFKYVT